ncbi:hypothetical protein [uncultured Slackia sp.]|uniref:hypothetical protein n=1 Tax=uncultured Slackia sp. TaxID=665903 RepID=UPI0026DEA39C|nr:hypothetical protein [uncultured Slackia sp.]
MQAPLSHARSLKPYVALAPIVAGLALSHTAMMVASFNGLTNGFEALRSGLATCIAAVPMLVAMAILYRARGPLPEKSVDTAFFISIIVQSVSIMALGSDAIDGSQRPRSRPVFRPSPPSPAGYPSLAGCGICKRHRRSRPSSPSSAPSA